MVTLINLVAVAGGVLGAGHGHGQAVQLLVDVELDGDLVLVGLLANVGDVLVESSLQAHVGPLGPGVDLARELRAVGHVKLSVVQALGLLDLLAAVLLLLPGGLGMLLLKLPVLLLILLTIGGTHLLPQSLLLLGVVLALLGVP